MKQAILITAYKDIQSLVDIVEFFDDRFNFYIHLDKKSDINPSELLQKPNVFITNHYKVNWGGFNHLQAILFLSKAALKNKDNTFFHLITGEDFPIKSVTDFLKIDISENYIKYYELPAMVWKDNGGLDRLYYYQFYDLFNSKTKFGKKIIESLVTLQKLIGFKRSVSNLSSYKLYGGSTYWSLNRFALDHVINFALSNKEFLSRFKNTFCAEEIFFHTVLVNSTFLNTIENTHLRFIDWTTGRGGYPAFLDESDFESLIKSHNIFARKIKKSDNLRNMLKDNFAN